MVLQTRGTILQPWNVYWLQYLNFPRQSPNIAGLEWRLFKWCLSGQDHKTETVHVQGVGNVNASWHSHIWAVEYGKVALDHAWMGVLRQHFHVYHVYHVYLPSLLLLRLLTHYTVMFFFHMKYTTRAHKTHTKHGRRSDTPLTRPKI